MIRHAVENAIIGLTAGLLCALGGALKDAPHEGFKPLTFLRSPLAGLVGGLVALYWTTEPLLVFVFAGYFERLAVEGYKILRQEMPGKFRR